MVDDINDLTNELAKVGTGKVKAIADNDRVYLVIQDAPDELRRLAAALERINVKEIKALIAYMNPEDAKKIAEQNKGKVDVLPPEKKDEDASDS